MQDELVAENAGTIIRLLSCNQIGADSGVPGMIVGRDLPLTQDNSFANVWVNWGVTYRDVVILDVDNFRVGVYNLTVHDLADPANYAELKAMLKAAAGE